MLADTGKKLKVGEEEIAEQIDGELLVSIEKLQEVQDELEKINEEASEKVLELEQKYNKVRRPVYDRRNNIIKGIPEFWSTAFQSHPALGELLSEEDEKVFKYLGSIDVEDSNNGKTGYSISFNFNPNPFFEDSKLTKSFTFLDDGTAKVTATSIKWKEGMGLPSGAANAKKGNKRPHEADESFFSWFSVTHQKNCEKDCIHESHDEIAEIISEDLWPNPLAYFNNEEDDEVDFEGDEGNEEENYGDGSEDDDDEDGDEDEGN